jgi:hypothetical protein
MSSNLISGTKNYIMKKEILWIIEEFELGAITAFECIQQIKVKTKKI